MESRQALEEDRRSWKLLGETAGISAVYLGLTLALTRPGVSRFTTHFMADDGDGWHQVWGLWWVKTALAHGQWPWWTDRLFAPDGVPLYFHGLGFTNGLMSVPLQWVFPLTVAHNVVVVAAFVLGGLALHALVRSLGGDGYAAFLGGCLFTFSPFHFAHGIGHLQLMPIWWLPLYGWALLKVSRTHRARDAVAAGAVLFGVVLTDYYFALYSVLGTLLVMAWYRVWRMPTLVLGTAGVLSLPLVVPMARLWLTTPLISGHDPIPLSADVLGFVIPGQVSAWGGPFASLWRRFTGPPSESGMYLGLLPLAIVGLALHARVRRVVPWITGAGVFALLALGPWLHVAGSVTPVPLPYLALTAALPPLELGGVPARFMVMVYLCLAVAVGLGLSELWRDLPYLLRRLVFLVLAAGLLLEYAPGPYTTSVFPASSTYAELAREPDRGDSIMDLPPGHFQVYPVAMLFQTVHGKRLVGGYIARAPLHQYEAFRRHPVVNFLYHPVPCSDEIRSEMEQRLRHDRVRWIVLHYLTDYGHLAACLRLPAVEREGGLILLGPLQPS